MSLSYTCIQPEPVATRIPVAPLNRRSHYSPLRSLRADRPTARFSAISRHGDLMGQVHPSVAQVLRRRDVTMFKWVLGGKTRDVAMASDKTYFLMSRVIFGFLGSHTRPVHWPLSCSLFLLEPQLLHCGTQSRFNKGCRLLTFEWLRLMAFSQNSYITFAHGSRGGDSDAPPLIRHSIHCNTAHRRPFVFHLTTTYHITEPP